MGFTEFERINLELDWFMELRDALYDGRIEEATGSVDHAIRELRKLRAFLMDNLPIDSSATDSDIDFPALAIRRVPKAELLTKALRRYVTCVETLIRKSQIRIDDQTPRL